MLLRLSGRSFSERIKQDSIEHIYQYFVPEIQGTVNYNPIKPGVATALGMLTVAVFDLFFVHFYRHGTSKTNRKMKRKMATVNAQCRKFSKMR